MQHLLMVVIPEKIKLEKGSLIFNPIDDCIT
jgi:hypothetical protein